MFFSAFIDAVQRFFHPDKIISPHLYRRRIWLTALTGCILFWLLAGLVIIRLFSC